jgi:phytoene desaturase
VAKIVVIGAGLAGLASAALLARTGHSVTVIEAGDWLGGKSRRIEVGGQRIDTGPSLVTFPGVWRELLRRYNSPVSGVAEPGLAESITDLKLTRLDEVGRYFFRDEMTDLPVREGHRWHEAWSRFEAGHGVLGEQITSILTKDPFDRSVLPDVLRLLKTYGRNLNTRSYLNSLKWMPAELREIISIHTLNAGVAPEKTLALFATMPAVMASEGVWVPEGGVNEIPLAIARLAAHAGVEILTGTRVEAVQQGLVRTSAGDFACDLVVSSLDQHVLAGLLGEQPKPSKQLSCSGIAIFASLKTPLPLGTATHSVVMPDRPDQLHRALAERVLPDQTMMFLNYYRPGYIYDNEKATAAVLLTAPADGKSYDLSHPWVQREVARVSAAVGLEAPITELFDDYRVLDPSYFASIGAEGGALYGEARPFWRSGPFHRPNYSDRARPWLYRVGASVHPGGGIPAVLSGAMIVAARISKRKIGS